MPCLDTSFIVEIFRGNKHLKQALNKFEMHKLSIPSPAITELWYGALLARSSNFEKEKIDNLLASLTILELDEESAKEAAEIRLLLEREGKELQTADLLIAGIARANNETLVTCDADYARIPGLTVIKY